MKTCETCKHMDRCQLNRSVMRKGAICTAWEDIPDPPITWAPDSLDAAAALLRSWKEDRQ